MCFDIKDMLDSSAEYQKYLFNRGFLITDSDIKDIKSFPFYGNWNVTKLFKYNFAIHNETKLFFKQKDNQYLFLIGHAVNPFDMTIGEDKLLENLIKLDGNDFWEYESNLTGVYVMGRVFEDGNIVHWSDCAGMRMSYYGSVDGSYYITSHTNIVAYLCGLSEDMYIKKLKTRKCFSLFGNVLPGDLSAYSALKRTVPNHYYSNSGTIMRFFPLKQFEECRNDTDYNSVLRQSAEILKNTMLLFSQKWKDKKVAISVTGGKDSGVTLASANGIYDRFDYFSYISKPEESVDSDAASVICGELGLNHRIINIENFNEKIEDFDLINEIIYCNSGNVGYLKPNEVRKRSVLIKDNEIDVEIKSWVNEIVRAYWYKKYSKNSFPKKPNGRYLTTLYKVFLWNRILFFRTAKVFDDYIKKYMSKEDLLLIKDWTTFWSWEFGFSAGEGLSLFSEHVLSFDIAIPFNNRKLIFLMLKPKLNDRINDRLQKDIIRLNNPKQADLNINVINAAHTSKRAKLEKLYLEINTRSPL